MGLSFMKIFKSNFCKLAFLLSTVFAYFALPIKLLSVYDSILAFLFIAVFALTMSCVIRLLKENFSLALKSGKPLVSVIAAAAGIGAFQLCSVSAPVCGSAAVGIASVAFPAFFEHFFVRYSYIIIYFSIALQLISLYYMGCLKKEQAR